MKRIFIASFLAIAPAGAALAQGANPAQIQTQVPGAAPGRPANGAPRDKAPPALPGARAEPNAVAPAAKNAMDLPPNEALFDAINRGDLAVAKDAISRGADLNATNVLGLTPIELAVDLGRNQLSFYLLSLRGGVAGSALSGNSTGAPGGGRNVGTRAAANDDGKPAPLTRAERLAQARAERAQRVNARGPVSDGTNQAVPQTARLFSGGGGQANPQAGFLGFDAGR